MPAKNKNKTQTKIMTAWLIALTGLSLVLVLYERVKIAEKSQADSLAGSGVAGQQVANLDSLEKYRLITSANFIYYQEMRFKKESGQLQDYELESLKLALLATGVPAIYQDLHLRLIKLTEELAKSEPNFLVLDEQERLAIEQYPWLLK